MDDDWSLFCFGNPGGDFEYRLTADQILYKMADKLKKDQVMYYCQKFKKKSETIEVCDEGKLFMDDLMCDLFYDDRIDTKTPKGMDNLCLFIDFLKDGISKEDFFKVFTNKFICNYENHEKFLESNKDSLSDLFLKLNRLLLREYLLIYSKKSYRDNKKMDNKNILNKFAKPFRALREHLQQVELPTMLFHEKLFEKTSSEVTFDDFVKDKKEFLKKEMYQDPNVQEVAKEYIESLKNIELLYMVSCANLNTGCRGQPTPGKTTLKISKQNNNNDDVIGFNDKYTNKKTEKFDKKLLSNQYNELFKNYGIDCDIQIFRGGIFLCFDYDDFDYLTPETKFDKILLYLLKNEDQKFKNIISLFLKLNGIFENDSNSNLTPVEIVDSYILATRLIMLILTTPKIKSKSRKLRLDRVLKNNVKQRI